MFVKIDRCLSEYVLNKLCEGHTATNPMTTQCEDQTDTRWQQKTLWRDNVAKTKVNGQMSKRQVNGHLWDSDWGVLESKGVSLSTGTLPRSKDFDRKHFSHSWHNCVIKKSSQFLKQRGSPVCKNGLYQLDDDLRHPQRSEWHQLHRASNKKRRSAFNNV